MRERRYFLLAEKYGQTPNSVREWSDYDVERAWMHFTVESEQEVTDDDVKRAKEKQVMAAKPGFILDCDYSHWSKFITDGALDQAKLQAGGYTAGQHEGIAEEMVRLGWLGEIDEGTGEPNYKTGELIDDGETHEASLGAGTQPLDSSIPE